MFKADTFPQDCRFGAMKTEQGSTLFVLWCSLQADVGSLFLPGVVGSPADDQGFGILLPVPCGARLVAGGLALFGGVSAGLGKKTAFFAFLPRRPVDVKGNAFTQLCMGFSPKMLGF